MPAGQGVVGYIAFAGVKFAGYTLAAFALKKAYPSAGTSTIKVGLARTGIGIVAGALFGGIWLLLSTRFEDSWPDWMAGSVFFGLLIPIRLAEWSLLIHLFFDRGLVQRAKDLKCAAYGSLWSFVLDAIGIVAAFVVPGGFWIC